MKSKKQFSLAQIQWLIWLILLVVYTLPLLAYDSWLNAVFYGATSVLVFAAIIYGNAFVLLPKLYEKGKKIQYYIVVPVFIFLLSFIRYYINYYAYVHFFAVKETPRFLWSGIFNNTVTGVLIYISSILFYVTLNYFKLKRTQEKLQKQQVVAELNLLKAQVQPHFLFNTLNNIYFIAQRESPGTAALLEKLSYIMRYFVDEAPKEKIGLQAELNFISNYIDLEKMRMRYPLQLTITPATVSEHITLPPMLFIPLVENVFKHGIDKKRDDNFITLTIVSDDNRLSVTVLNKLSSAGNRREKSGTGLRNLSERLKLLFGDDFILDTTADKQSSTYRAHLNIPL